MEQKIKLELTVQEINSVLTALIQRPFVEVNDLVAKIRDQAQPQINPEPSE